MTRPPAPLAAGLNRRSLLAGLAATPGLAYAQGLPGPAPLAPFTADQRDLAARTLEAAETHGLPRREVPDDDPALAAALLRYAKEVHAGRLDLGAFEEVWGVRPAPYDPQADFAAALAVDRLGAWLDSLPPPYAGYGALRRGLAAYRKIGARGGWRPVPAGAPPELGERSPRVAALMARLAAEDEAVAPGGIFDEPARQALARAQRRFGLNPDGVLGAGTVAALNRPVGERVLQILANLERWRWLPPQMPATRVQVNSGAAIVTLFRDDKPVLSMKAVSGRPGDETPMLLSQIHSIVLNPPWNVPSSIAAKELWPKEHANPGYLKRNDYVVIPLEAGGARLQQRAGPKSALGRFKFDFDNPYGVYLHDTPAQSGFSRYTRLASHGCVRLEKPGPLAKALLTGDPQWTDEMIDAAVAGGKTVRASLPQPIPVFIFYWTAFAGAGGVMNFRDDPYGWDRLLLQKLGLVGVAAQPGKETGA